MYFASVDADTADDLDKAAKVFAMRGPYEEALRYQERALMLRTEAFGPKVSKQQLACSLWGAYYALGP